MHGIRTQSFEQVPRLILTLHHERASAGRVYHLMDTLRQSIIKALHKLPLEHLMVQVDSNQFFETLPRLVEFFSL